MKTREQIEQDYIDNGGNLCPYCGSSHITGNEIDFPSDGVISQLIMCGSCQRTWSEYYTLTSIGIEDEEEES